VSAKYFWTGLVWVAAVLTARGQITIQEDYPIDQMVARYVSYNRAHPFVAGWRIQVSASTERYKVQADYERFTSLFPGIPAEWSHENPFYKLRAGAYQTKLEALAAVQPVKAYFKMAFPAYDRHIPVSEILRTSE